MEGALQAWWVDWSPRRSLPCQPAWVMAHLFTAWPLCCNAEQLRNGVAVVNIDNGYGAGCLAARINQCLPKGLY